MQEAQDGIVRRTVEMMEGKAAAFNKAVQVGAARAGSVEVLGRPGAMHEPSSSKEPSNSLKRGIAHSAHACSHTCTRTKLRAHTHTHTHTHAHTHTHIHTHTCTCSFMHAHARPAGA